MSGIWERLVRSVKLALKALLGQSMVNDEVLVTTFVEVERILNSRPICRSSEDPRDENVLTPAHLLLQRRVMSLPPGKFVDQDIYCRKRWRQAQILANHFWKRWLKEYMTVLQERAKWFRKQREAKVGDLVMMVEENVPRGRWPLARIIKTFPSHDGHIRRVQVKANDSVYIRPIQKLCLLEEE